MRPLGRAVTGSSGARPRTLARIFARSIGGLGASELRSVEVPAGRSRTIPTMVESKPERDPGAVRRRALRDGLVIAGLLGMVYFYLVLGDANWHGPTADGLIYWAVDPADPYRNATVGAANAYLYSPAFAQVFWLIGRLPREVFIVGWTAFIAGVAIWLARPWPWALLILAVPVSQDVVIGNIHVLLAAAIVLGFRWPGTWAFVLLTKVTPGVALAWFVARREWRHLAIAVLATVAIAAVSFAIAPGVWGDWYRVLRSDGGNESSRLIPRLAAAAGIAAWGGLTNRRWAVPLAAMLSLPVIWSDSFAMLLGCVAVSGPVGRLRTRPADRRPSHDVQSELQPEG
jgi:hypothetical protein